MKTIVHHAGDEVQIRKSPLYSFMLIIAIIIK
jgi:hypothetical protein